MSVLVFGLNYKTASVGLLERMAVPAERLAKALRSLTDREHVTEAVVLSTCNRVEVYANVTRYHGGVADLRNFMSEWGGVAPEDFAGLAYDYYDDRAAAHLFAVASGLDSMVVGERQIHLQVKQAFLDADQERASGRVLQTLFRRALRVAKRTRAETGISSGASSMVDVGLDAARQTLGDLDGRTVLVVGAGKMGGMAASRLHRVAGRILIANRTPEKAERLAARIAGELVGLESLTDALADADVVLTSTGASQPVIDSTMVERAAARRNGRPLVLLDLAVPRDIEPTCAALPGVELLDIDAIRALTDTGRTGAEVTRARRLVDAEARAFSGWTRTVRVEPTIGALHLRGEEIRRSELERLAGRLGALDDKQRDALDALTRGIVKTLLHEPSVRLKAIADADAEGGEHHASALRDLFDLPE